MKRFEEFTPEEQKIILRDYKKAIAKGKRSIMASLRVPMGETRNHYKGQLFQDQPAGAL